MAEILRSAGCPDGWVPFVRYGDGRLILGTLTSEGYLNAEYAIYVKPPSEPTNFVDAKRLLIPFSDFDAAGEWRTNDDIHDAVLRIAGEARGSGPE